MMSVTDPCNTVPQVISFVTDGTLEMSKYKNTGTGGLLTGDEVISLFEI
mgnify:CR=1 FL=1|jgi:hypothetical protein